MSSLVLVLRVGVSLAVVLGLLALAARAASRRGLGNAPGKTAARVDVLARQGLGRNTSVVIVRAVDRALVLGVTETSVSLLADADLSVLDLTEDASPDAPGMVRSGGPLLARPSAWKDTLDHLRERTVRRS
ncbi:MAG: fliO [Acidimicrobiales bacterium]|nr:fliO [Acidimicrobiales bacterium]